MVNVYGTGYTWDSDALVPSYLSIRIYQSVYIFQILTNPTQALPPHDREPFSNVKACTLYYYTGVCWTMLITQV